jgi:transcriptional regulator GlxA family with amidase domain
LHSRRLPTDSSFCLDELAVLQCLEEARSKHIDRKIDMPTLRVELGVAERTLRLCCAEILGVSPMRYVLLQRANSSRLSVAEIVRNHQFLELGHFAVTYRNIFGESASTARRRSPRK